MRAHLAGLRRENAEAYYRDLGESLKRAGLLKPPAAAPSAPQEPPKPTLRAEDGSLVYDQQGIDALLKWHAQQLRQEFGATLKPLNEMRETMTAQQIRTQATEQARETLGIARQWDGFKDLEPQIKALMQANRGLTLLAAYNHVYQQQLPTRDQTLRAKTRQDTLDELKRAPVSPSLRPGAAPPSTTGAKARTTNALVDQAVDRFLAQS